MSEDAAPAIEARGLTKRYGRIAALDGIDLSVPAGSVFGFLGPNGAGKTTTLRILASLGRATSGTASIDGVPVGGGEPNRRGLIGYLDQDPRFHGWMRARELLELVGRLYGMSGAPLRARVDEALELVDLTDAGRRTIGGFSGGMRQRLGLAQAIMNRPPVLLLDEPVSALDPEGRRDILEVIADLGTTSTVLFSTHILNDVERVCDHVAILDHGRLVTTAAIDELLARYARPVWVIEPDAAAAVTPEMLQAALGEVPGVMSSEVTHGTLRLTVTHEATSAELLAAIARTGIPVLGAERQRPTLEDVFLQLVGRGAHEASGEAVA